LHRRDRCRSFRRHWCRRRPCGNGSRSHPANDLSDLNFLASRFEDFAQRSSLWGSQLHGGFVGFNLDDDFVAFDRVTGVLEPAQNGSLGD